MTPFITYIHTLPHPALPAHTHTPHHLTPAGAKDWDKEAHGGQSKFSAAGACATTRPSCRHAAQAACLPNAAALTCSHAHTPRSFHRAQALPVGGTSAWL